MDMNMETMVKNTVSTHMCTVFRIPMDIQDTPWTITMPILIILLMETMVTMPMVKLLNTVSPHITMENITHDSHWVPNMMPLDTVVTAMDIIRYKALFAFN